MTTKLTQGPAPFILLTLLCLALFLPGLAGLPPTDRDESRFAQASKQMMESGDYIRIQFQGESRAKKPAGIYWLQVASVKLTGVRDAIWAYRLPSAFGAWIAVMATFAFGRRLVGDRAALLAAAFLASSVLLVSEAHQAKTDAVQLACVVIAQGVLGRFYLERNQPWPMAMLFWLAQGAGILIKGPIVPMISLLTVGTLWIADRRLDWLGKIRPFSGLALVALLVGPWAWAINQATQGQFIGQAVKNDLLSKLMGAQESHGAPPGTYLLLLTATLWPASLFVIPALPEAIRRRREAATRFLLAWILPNWLIFEAIPTKLPHYILPVYPALLLIGALWLTEKDEPNLRPWQKIFSLLWALAGSLLAIAVVAAPLALKMPPLWSLLPVAIILLLLGWLPAAALWRRPERAGVSAIIAAVATYAAIFLLVVPRLEPLFVSQRIADLVPASAPLASAGYSEPSLVFLHGTDTLLTDGEGAADFLLHTPDGWAAIDRTAESAFHDRLSQAGREAITTGQIDGLDAAKGHPVQITLWRLAGM